MLHIHACSKHMFQVFSGVSYVCLQVFYLDVAYICNGFQIFFKCFRKCFRRFVSSALSVFFSMLQLLYLDISKVDRVLRMGCAWKAAGEFHMF